MLDHPMQPAALKGERMLRLSVLVKAIGSAFAFCLITVTLASAQGNGIPERLSRIEKLLQQIITSVTPEPPATQNTTRLLFPFVTNQAGFDTGVAVSNTGLDSSGTVGTAGTCTIHYFGQTTGGGSAPASQTTNAPIPPGGQLTFVLSTGGNFGIAARPGFQGYIEIDCAFAFAHGFGFLTDGPIGQARIGTTIPALVIPSQRTAAESAGQ
jgi:hypothetical protein